jgi:hypothetical protein
VRAPVVIEARIGDAPAVPFFEMPPLGFLVAGDDRDRAVVQWRDQDVVYLRQGDAWQAQPPQPFVQGATRHQRWALRDSGSGTPLDDTRGKGGGFVKNEQGTWRAHGSDSIQFTQLGADFKVTKTVATGHDKDDEIVHGFDPSGRFYAFVAPGLRLLFDVTRFESKKTITPTPTPDAAR